MKYILALSVLILVSCKSKKSCQQSFVVENPIIYQSNNCPENYKCTIELIPNKSIVFKTDNLGVMYPEISEGEKTLLKYTYDKIRNPQYDDNFQTEIIYAELNKNISEINISDEKLDSIKLHFGRFCYCKGEPLGYFPIKNGAFKLKKTSKDSINIEMNFTLKGVPNKVSEVKETFLLK